MRPVIFVAPFCLPATMRFAKAAARLPGVRLLAVLQEPPRGADRQIFSDVVLVKDALSTGDLIAAIEVLRQRHGQPHRIIGILEPLQVQLAEARVHFEVYGTDPDTADLFRDKARMKDRLRAGGLPVARHKLVANAADAEAFEAEVGFPMVLKPPAGMGAKATFRVNTSAALQGAVLGMGASERNPVLAEEFLRGEEGSCDTLTIGGEQKLISISHYRPTPLVVLENPWVQWCVTLPRVCTGPGYDDVQALGVEAIEVLGLRDGFTHMEWFRREDGSLAIGEIAQRPPGAQITGMIGQCYDADPFRLWARAVVDGAFDGPYERKYAAGCAYLRGMGRGRVSSVTGVEAANREIGPLVVDARMPTPGAPKNDSYEGDGFAMVRAPDTETVDRALQTIIQTVRTHYA